MTACPVMLGQVHTPSSALRLYMDKKAETARPHVVRLRPDLALFACPHPSALFVSRRKGNREIILNVFQQVTQFLSESPATNQVPRSRLCRVPQ